MIADQSKILVKHPLWNSELLASMSKLQSKGLLCDTTLECSDGVSVRAHSCILAAASGRVRALLTGAALGYYTLRMRDVTSSTWHHLLRFVYDGQVSVEPDDLTHVYDAAMRFQIVRLTDALENCGFIRTESFKVSEKPRTACDDVIEICDDEIDDDDEGLQVISCTTASDRDCANNVEENNVEELLTLVVADNNKGHEEVDSNSDEQPVTAATVADPVGLVARDEVNERSIASAHSASDDRSRVSQDPEQTSIDCLCLQQSVGETVQSADASDEVIVLDDDANDVSCKVVQSESVVANAADQLQHQASSVAVTQPPSAAINSLPLVVSRDNDATSSSSTVSATSLLTDNDENSNVITESPSSSYFSVSVPPRMQSAAAEINRLHNSVDLRTTAAVQRNNLSQTSDAVVNKTTDNIYQQFRITGPSVSKAACSRSPIVQPVASSNNYIYPHQSLQNSPIDPYNFNGSGDSSSGRPSWQNSLQSTADMQGITGPSRGRISVGQRAGISRFQSMTIAHLLTSNNSDSNEQLFGQEASTLRQLVSNESQSRSLRGPRTRGSRPRRPRGSQTWTRPMTDDAETQQQNASTGEPSRRVRGGRTSRSRGSRTRRSRAPSELLNATSEQPTCLQLPVHATSSSGLIESGTDRVLLRGAEPSRRGRKKQNSDEDNSKRMKTVQFVGRRITHEWIVRGKSVERKWFNGLVKKLLSGVDGQPKSRYLVKYDGEEDEFEIDHLVEDYLDGSVNVLS